MSPVKEETTYAPLKQFQFLLPFVVKTFSASPDLTLEILVVETSPPSV